ncbi:TonB-dependent receptor plug domain-containing protein [Pseudidiomarina donghaiensis]|uniref:TonB-dependent receptor n=1 Tax=Pseudidiomarina donghaiensis TaxID=519452 RepID=A0A432XF77_9GAMM|nr:TonB-dependent receptor [Pseudidiomarina donghaiensis]RUO47393.1 TonB-dependent receptor [Pseudidiomarina donghaiensis]SFV22974.1 iron complex outermembrane recepter protein [Pseudidiomarina donghaiensis]
MKRSTLSLALATVVIPSFSLISNQAVAQETNTASVDETINVIGSRLSLRTATDGTAPVDIITEDELTAGGFTETAQALQYAVPSFNFPRSSITDGSDAVRPASLRGLSPDHTLVLINGKRRHSSALVHLNGTTGRGSSNADLNAIPVSSIKRIEVLRDGAAALYGSDAIAGVINIVLKDQSEGGSITANAGQTFEGDGEQYKVHGNIGFGLGDGGSFTLSAEYHHKNKTNRAGLDPRQQYPLVNGAPDPREATFNRLNHHVGDASFENKAVFFNANLPVGQNGELYAFGGMSDRTSQSGAFYRRALDNRNVIEVYPDGFLPLLSPETSDASLLGGYKFILGNWDVDASASFGQSEFQYRLENSLNASFGPSTPTSFNAGTLTTDELNANIDVSRFIPFVNNSDLAVAFGISYRENSYQIEAGDPASYEDGGYDGRPAGSQGFTGFKPESEVDDSRDNVGVYVELENRLTSQFQWGAALRYEDYSDFGDNTSWKLSGRYDVTDNFAIRATANTGFRAPSVQQIYFTNISTLFVNRNGELVPEQSGTFNNVSTVARELQLGALQPEESQNLSLGFVWSGNDGLSLTVDAFQIKIDDRVILSSSLVPSDSQAVADALAAAGADNARFFINAVDTTTKGLDVVLTKDFAVGAGDLTAQLAYGYNETEIDGVNLPTIIGDLEAKLFDSVERTRMTRSVPRHSGNISFTHKLDRLTSRIAFNYFGDYVLENNAGLQTEFGGKWITDISAGYQVSDSLKVNAGVQNLFDEYPDKQDPSNQFNGIFIYPNTNAPFGFNGGYYYAELTYSF